jgi:hypothetical protein
VGSQPATEGKDPPPSAAPEAVVALPLDHWFQTCWNNIDKFRPAVACNSRHDEYLVVWEDVGEGLGK